MNTKKILIYGGGAVVLGAVGFFVWSFFQKTDMPLVENTKPLDDENTPTKNVKPVNSGINPFGAMLDTTFQPIKTPTLAYDTSWLNQFMTVKS